jgi:hypothetical protein
MQCLRTVISQTSSTINFLLPKSNIWSTNLYRGYVRAFWSQNNAYPIHGHKQNPPKLMGYCRKTLKIRRDIIRPSEIKRMRHRGWEGEFSTVAGRNRIMENYLKDSPFLAETI